MTQLFESQYWSPDVVAHPQSQPQKAEARVPRGQELDEEGIKGNQDDSQRLPLASV